MKASYLIVAIALIAGCASTKYISTKQYSDEITDHCINNLPEHLKEDRDSKADCAMKSASKMNYAYRIYQTRAESDLKECRETNSNPEAVDSCFAKMQDAYYQNVVSRNIEE